MSRWSDWNILCYNNGDEDTYEIYEELDHPACYELGVSQEDDDQIDPVYVGETINLAERMEAYGSHGSHLEEIIQEHLDDGFLIHFRYQAKESKEEAKEMQDNLLAQYDYDWNIMGNSDK